MKCADCAIESHDGNTHLGHCPQLKAGGSMTVFGLKRMSDQQLKELKRQINKELYERGTL